VAKETTSLGMPDAVATKKASAVARATLTEDGNPLAGRTVQFLVQDKIRNQVVWTSIGSAVTNASGLAELTVPTKWVSTAKRPIQAVFAGDATFLSATANAFVYRA
jgi:hypothetical protein